MSFPTGLSTAAPVLQLEAITKTYDLGGSEFSALKGISFEIVQGEFVALMGPSGSGKSTLMNILGILDSATSGSYRLAGTNVTDLSEDERAEVRNRFIGFVFQAFHLLPRYSLLENVETPLMYAGMRPKVRRARALEMLAKVGLEDKAHTLPTQISGGQKQRVAVARALSLSPALILADEPTGNLDTRTGDEIMGLFHDLNAEGVTVVVVTHDPEIALQTRRTLWVRDGLLEGDERHSSERPVRAPALVGA